MFGSHGQDGFTVTQLWAPMSYGIVTAMTYGETTNTGSCSVETYFSLLRGTLELDPHHSGSKQINEANYDSLILPCRMLL